MGGGNDYETCLKCGSMNLWSKVCVDMSTFLGLVNSFSVHFQFYLSFHNQSILTEGGTCIDGSETGHWKRCIPFEQLKWRTNWTLVNQSKLCNHILQNSSKNTLGIVLISIQRASGNTFIIRWIPLA